MADLFFILLALGAFLGFAAAIRGCERL